MINPTELLRLSERENAEWPHSCPKIYESVSPAIVPDLQTPERTHSPRKIRPSANPYRAHAVQRIESDSIWGMNVYAKVMPAAIIAQSRNRYQSDFVYDGLKQCGGIASRNSLMPTFDPTCYLARDQYIVLALNNRVNVHPIRQARLDDFCNRSP